MDAKTAKALTADEIAAVIREEFGDVIGNPEPTIVISTIPVTDNSVWQPLAYFLREDDRMKFDFLASLSGVDYNDGTFGVVYHLQSLATHKHKIAFRLKCPKENPVIPTVMEIWKAANWHERETFDLYGIKFDGHPDLRRILCPEDWEGYPLRKDYKVQETYHGIKVPY